MGLNRKKAKGRRSGKPFTGIPWDVLDHPDVVGLKGNSFKLLVYLARQYRGNNNGDLSVAYSVMKGKFNSKATLTSARDELLSKGLIMQTREGKFTNPGGICALYALTWQPIDECSGKLDVEPTTTAPRSFRLLKANN